MKKLNYNFTSLHWVNHKFPCSKPTKDRLYVKILRFIAENPGKTRKAIGQAVIKWNYDCTTHSTEWASIHQAGLISLYRHGNSVLYFITKKGSDLLASV